MSAPYPDPIDGFTVENDGDMVVITLSNRYGWKLVFAVPRDDARELGTALMHHALNG
jgi:hypothetical protein